MEADSTTPDSEITAISVVPPPTSTIRCPSGLAISIPAPMAAATGSSIRYTLRAPAWIPASITARSSTSVIPEGTQIMTGLEQLEAVYLMNKLFEHTLRSYRNLRSHRRAAAGWPTMFRGLRPSIAWASAPTFRSFQCFYPLPLREGSLRTMRPAPFDVYQGPMRCPNQCRCLLPMRTCVHLIFTFYIGLFIPVIYRFYSNYSLYRVSSSFCKRVSSFSPPVLFPNRLHHCRTVNLRRPSQRQHTAAFFNRASGSDNIIHHQNCAAPEPKHSFSRYKRPGHWLCAARAAQGGTAAECHALSPATARRADSTVGPAPSPPTPTGRSPDPSGCAAPAAPRSPHPAQGTLPGHTVPKGSIRRSTPGF